MNTSQSDRIRSAFLLTGALAVLSPAFETSMRLRAADSPAHDLTGLWQAKGRFGPDVRGTLLLQRDGDAWRAEIGGRTAPARKTGDGIAFDVPGGLGHLDGKIEPDGGRVRGHWIQRTAPDDRGYASPITLTRAGPDCWRGEVVPLDDVMTLYLMMSKRPDGSLGAFLRNPERNVGRFIAVDHVERQGDSVRLVGRGSSGGKDQIQGEGVFHGDALSIWFPGLEGTYDLRRVKDGEPSDFFPRGRPGAPYAYVRPPAGDDGWPVASLDEVGISRDDIGKFVRTLIDTPIDTIHASDVHAVLIARHGKLVLEEYFHGEHREKPHDTRSAAKSATSTLIGAAIQAGLPVDVNTPVYRVMNGGEFPPGLEPRKRALTLEHLLTMSSGLDCDDGNPKSAGQEDVMQEQTTQPDWYRFTLDLAAVRDPGKKAAYGSASPNLAGGVLARATGRPLIDLFHDLVAEPLDIRRYYLNLTPTGTAYMGGGARFLPRDFMKLGQLMLNRGTWNGRRVLSEDWCRKATSPLYQLGSNRYGYLWWVTDYPYHGHQVRAFFAGGNGGQVVMGIPELDLVIAFYGGNYSDPALFIPQREYVPKFILPAVAERG